MVDPVFVTSDFSSPDLYQIPFMAESGFDKWVIMGDSFMAVSIIGVSGFAEYDIMGDSFIAVSIIGDSGFVKRHYWRFQICIFASLYQIPL
jgi:hypothetical protein